MEKLNLRYSSLHGLSMQSSSQSLWITRTSRVMTVFIFVLFLSSQLTHAEEIIEDPSSTYSPEFCEFGVTFPEEPYTVRRCEDPENKERCYDLVSYTQVYGLESTVNFRVICNPIGPEIYKEYSPEVMELTLRALTKDSVVEEFDSSFREEDTYKQAGIVGEGYVGRTPTIYIAQLWIGQKSALSVEAELIGEALPDADQVFSDVLKSIGINTQSTCR